MKKTILFFICTIFIIITNKGQTLQKKSNIEIGLNPTNLTNNIFNVDFRWGNEKKQTRISLVNIGYNTNNEDDNRNNYDGYTNINNKLNYFNIGINIGFQKNK